MKLILLLSILSIILWGCGDRAKLDELQRQNEALQNTNNQLHQDLVDRDDYVEKVTGSINDIHTSLEAVKAEEHSLLRETTGLESQKKLTRDEVRAKVFDKIDAIKATLRDNHKRLAAIQSQLSSSRKQYAGLKKMLEDLRITLAGRDSSIAKLNLYVQGLERDVTDKGKLIAQRDSVIRTQFETITTAYYIEGTRDELEQMGIIHNEGGFLWGLLGSTTTLASGFDDKYFKPINKTMENTISVKGKIDEIIPRRNAQYYKKTDIGEDETTLTIAQPNDFWKDRYLVIVTDRPVAD